MDRGRFVALTGAVATRLVYPRAASAAQAPAAGEHVAQAELFASAPAAQAKQWVQYVMGSGVPYLKQIGFGVEPAEAGDRRFIETQVGIPGGSCNPNTLKKAYLQQGAFGALMTPYAVDVYVVKSGNFFTTWGGKEGSTPIGHEQRLLLLDAAYLYDLDRSATVTAVAHESVTAAGKTFATTRVTTTYGATAARGDEPRVTDMTVWLSPRVPLGVVKLHVGLTGIDPFTLRLDSFGEHFKTAVAMPLDTVKALTRSA